MAPLFLLFAMQLTPDAVAAMDQRPPCEALADVERAVPAVWSALDRERDLDGQSDFYADELAHLIAEPGVVDATVVDLDAKLAAHREDRDAARNDGQAALIALETRLAIAMARLCPPSRP